LALISSPPVEKNLLSKSPAAALRKPAVKLTVASDARRSCPAGGSFAKEAHGVASGHAMCSGKALEMTEVCPGVSISGMTSIPRCG
jgi:hypothetical protein